MPGSGSAVNRSLVVSEPPMPAALGFRPPMSPHGSPSRHHAYTPPESCILVCMQGGRSPPAATPRSIRWVQSSILGTWNSACRPTSPHASTSRGETPSSSPYLPRSKARKRVGRGMWLARNPGPWPKLLFVRHASTTRIRERTARRRHILVRPVSRNGQKMTSCRVCGCGEPM